MTNRVANGADIASHVDVKLDAAAAAYCCCLLLLPSVIAGVQSADIERPVANNPNVYGINTAVLALAAGFAAASPLFVSVTQH